MSLTYEKCKELRDNGFPQEGNDYWVSEARFSVASLHRNVPPIHRKMDVMYDYILSPTLEELIEACGETVFFDLIKCKDGWLATDHYQRGEGSSHLEAVANLWIALNKK